MQGATPLLSFIGAVMLLITIMAVTLFVKRRKEGRRQQRLKVTERRVALKDALEACDMALRTASELRRTIRNLHCVREEERIPAPLLAEMIRHMDLAEARIAEFEAFLAVAADIVDDSLSNDSLRQLSDKYGLMWHRMHRIKDELMRDQFRMNGYVIEPATSESRRRASMQSAVRPAYRPSKESSSRTNAYGTLAANVVAVSILTSSPDLTGGSAGTTCGE